MADIVFNMGKGKVAYYGGLPAANDAIIWTPIETSGIVADATMRDYDDLAAVLAGASNEQTTMGRKTAASVVVTVDDTNDRTDVDCADLTWTAVPAGNAISAIVGTYDPDTTGGSDSDHIPLVKLDAVATPAGGDIVFQFNAAGFYRAA